MMDYKNIHGQDVSNFSSSSPHRMPTVSAAQALSELKSSPTRVISTGIPQLDNVLQNRDALNESDELSHGGVSRGQVTEIYGPPGVGKTAMGTQLAANVLAGGGKVVWIDAAHLLPGPRLSSILTASAASLASRSLESDSEAPSTSTMLKNLTHITIPSLPHLLALLSQKESTFPTLETSLIIIDSLSTLINSAFSKISGSASTPMKPAAGANPKPNKNDAAHWASNRKWTVLQHLISLLSKISTLKNIAIVILQQTATRMRDGGGAGLVPSISSTAWDTGIACRIVLFRDWGPEQGAESTRYAGVLKAEGVVGPSNNGLGKVVVFAIRDSGLVPAALPTLTSSTQMLSITKPTPVSVKRKLEIVDSEDEDGLDDSEDDYGWEEDDDAHVPDPPPQTQGSEDILIPGPVDLEEEVENDVGEDEAEDNFELEVH